MEGGRKEKRGEVRVFTRWGKRTTKATVEGSTSLLAALAYFKGHGCHHVSVTTAFFISSRSTTITNVRLVDPSVFALRWILLAISLNTPGSVCRWRIRISRRGTNINRITGTRQGEILNLGFSLSQSLGIQECIRPHIAARQICSAAFLCPY